MAQRQILINLDFDMNELSEQEQRNYLQKIADQEFEENSKVIIVGVDVDKPRELFVLIND